MRVKILLWVSLWPAEVDKHSGQGHRDICVTREIGQEEVSIIGILIYY